MTVTEAAQNKVNQVLNGEGFVEVCLEGDGCSGYEIKLKGSQNIPSFKFTPPTAPTFLWVRSKFLAGLSGCHERNQDERVGFNEVGTYGKDQSGTRARPQASEPIAFDSIVEQCRENYCD